MMKLYHKNPRQITATQFTDLDGSLLRLGDLGGIVHDLNSDEIIGGNQRSRVFNINQCEIQLIEQYSEPDEQGTVGHGFIIWKGKKYAYRQVRWTPEQCAEGNIRANKNGGSWDFDTLANEFELDDLLEWGFDKNELDLDLFGGEIDETYTRNIQAPIYTPKGDKPAIKDLFDDRRANELIAEINVSSLPDEEKEFLRIAARRHIVLNYKRIAEYYSHSEITTQALMENSALVIIDFSRAIELGYVKLSEEVAKQYLEEYPNA